MQPVRPHHWHLGQANPKNETIPQVSTAATLEKGSRAWLAVLFHPHWKNTELFAGAP
jgi:hypothetical protein